MAGQTFTILVCVAAMHCTTPHKALIQWLAEQMRQGIAISGEVTAFAASTFGSADLPSVLADSDDTETDSLLELIFYPDIALQKRYEARWGEHHFTEEEQSAVEAALCTMALEVPLLLPAAGDRFSVRPPDFALAAFVQRLNITFQPEAALVRTVKTSWPGEPGLRARVLLRNANRSWHTDQVWMLERFFNTIGPDTGNAEPLLPFMLSILPELKPGRDPYDFLISKKFFYFQSLCKAEDFERRRQTSNMEVMMLQGNLAAHGSIDDWRRCMRHIDIICRSLFGRTHFFQQPGNACVDLDTADSGQTIKDVIRILS